MQQHSREESDENAAILIPLSPHTTSVHLSVAIAAAAAAGIAVNLRDCNPPEPCSP